MNTGSIDIDKVDESYTGPVTVPLGDIPTRPKREYKRAASTVANEFKFRIEDLPGLSRHNPADWAPALQFADAAQGRWCCIREYSTSGACNQAACKLRKYHKAYEFASRKIPSGAGLYCRYVGK